MISLRNFSDKTAISLSAACTAHCLLLPVFFTWLPTSTALTLQDEAFHLSMVFLVIPISLLALWLGCREHRETKVALMGAAGIFLLLVAVFVGHDIAGELGEKLITVLGSIMIAAGHFWNFSLCRHKHCECSEQG